MSSYIRRFYERRYSHIFSKTLNCEKICSWDIAIINFLQKKKLAGCRILDVGAGEGLILRLLTKEHEVLPYAVDLSKSNLQVLRHNKIKAFSLDVSTEKLPFKNNFFDIVICSEVIEHLLDPEFALKEIYRVTKTNGELFLTTHNTFNIFMRIKFFLGSIPSPSFDILDNNRAEHIRIFNFTTIKKLLIRCGFQKISVYNYFALNNRPFFLPILKSLLGLHHFFICKK